MESPEVAFGLLPGAFGLKVTEKAFTIQRSNSDEAQSQRSGVSSRTNERGIFEKTINKLQQKEAEEKELKDRTFEIRQQNFIKATRQAMLLASQSSDLDDVQ